MTITDDDAWFTEWVEQWGDKITQFAYTYVHDRQLAEDIAQDTFLRLYQWHARDPRRPITPGWLYTTARNRAVDYTRQAARHPTSPVPADELESKDGAWDKRVAVQAILDGLPPTDRECLWLFYYADCSTQDIATLLGLSATAVRTRLSRARTRFADIWGRD